MQYVADNIDRAITHLAKSLLGQKFTSPPALRAGTRRGCTMQDSTRTGETPQRREPDQFPERRRLVLGGSPPDQIDRTARANYRIHEVIKAIDILPENIHSPWYDYEDRISGTAHRTIRCAAHRP